MSKQLKLDSFYSKKETKKRKFVEATPTAMTKKKKDVPFWWRDNYKNFLKVQNKIDKNEENGTISWTKQYISKSNWKSPINFDESNLKQKEKKQVVHKTTLSKKRIKRR